MPVIPGCRKYEPKHLWEHYKEIARRVSAGQRNKDIARDLGMHPVSVSVIKNSRIVQRQISKLQETADEKVTEIVPKVMSADLAVRELATDCANKLKAMVDSDELSDANKLRLHFGILDRAGVGPVSRSQNSHLVGTLTNDELLGMLGRAGLPLQPAPEDATYEEVDKAV